MGAIFQGSVSKNVQCLYNVIDFVTFSVETTPVTFSWRTLRFHLMNRFALSIGGLVKDFTHTVAVVFCYRSINEAHFLAERQG